MFSGLRMTESQSWIKTDRVDTAEELIDRYATQLKLYADALERVFAARKMKVKEILIYSFRLEKLISIE